MTTEFKDSNKLNVTTDMIKKLPEGQIIKSSMRPIVGSNGIFWAIHVDQYGGGYGIVYLWISKHEKMTACGIVNVGPAIPYKDEYSTTYDGNATINNILSGFYFNWLGPNGVIRVDVTFTNFEQPIFNQIYAINDFISGWNHYTPDATIVVDDKNFDIHRHILCMISPVFQAEFAHDTEESKSGIIKITDFDSETIKNVIDYCYGRDHEIKTVLDCINLLRFADKYDIRTIIKTFEPLLYNSISSRSFYGISEYAWDCERKDLQSKCAQFYKNNIAQIGLTPNFANMSPSILIGIISAASLLDTPNAAVTNATDQLDDPIRRVSEINAPTVHNFTRDSDHYPTDAQILVGDQRIDVHRHYLSMLSPVFYKKFMENKTGTIQVTDFDFLTVKNVINYCYGKVTIETSLSNENKVADILRFGHKYSIPKVVEMAEQILLADLSKDNFCSIVQYAWEFEKADLKLKCADFYRRNYESIQFTPDFLKMDAAVVIDILRQAASVEKP